MAGLRETKKARTRERIAAEATRLFVARGFDAVTVADVAEAAEVSKMTVFNHFPRKEDMFLDRLPEAAALLTAAVRGRPPGTEPLTALRALLVDLTHAEHPLSGVRDGTAPFVRTVESSPALLGRLREAAGELEELLAGLFDEAGAPHARLTAALAVAAYRTLAVDGARRILAGERGEALRAAHLDAVATAFDALDAAAAALRPPAPS